MLVSLFVEVFPFCFASRPCVLTSEVTVNKGQLRDAHRTRGWGVSGFTDESETPAPAGLLLGKEDQ